MLSLWTCFDKNLYCKKRYINKCDLTWLNGMSQNFFIHTTMMIVSLEFVVKIHISQSLQNITVWFSGLRLLLPGLLKLTLKSPNMSSASSGFEPPMNKGFMTSGYVLMASPKPRVFNPSVNLKQIKKNMW